MRRFLFVLVLSQSISCDHEQEKWELDVEQNFLSPMTYPSSAWGSNDFGIDKDKDHITLLQKFKPSFWVARGSYRPVDFYNDYLPNTVHKNSQGEIVNETVTRDILKAIERDPSAFLDFKGEHFRCEQNQCSEEVVPVYGRVFEESLKNPVNDDSFPVWVLKYSLVFSSSGLPERLSWYKEWSAFVFGNPDDWHELDIHGAIHLIVSKSSNRPLAVILAQHNYFRTYVVGQDLALGNGPLNICFASRTNEPYLCPESSDPALFGTVGSLENFALVYSNEEEALWDGGMDVVYGEAGGAFEIPTRVQTLPAKDPLYVSWISMGEKRKFLGFNNYFISGPPGMDLNSFRGLKKYTDLAMFWYFDPSDRQGFQLLEKISQDFLSADVSPLLEHNGKKFWSKLESVSR